MTDVRIWPEALAMTQMQWSSESKGKEERGTEEGRKTREKGGRRRGTGWRRERHWG